MSELSTPSFGQRIQAIAEPYGPEDLLISHPDPIVALLLSGAAETVHEAEELYLQAHLAEVVHLVESDLSELEFRQHPLIALLLSFGSRPREDSLR